jgi:hypothetical protein
MSCGSCRRCSHRLCACVGVHRAELACWMDGAGCDTSVNYLRHELPPVLRQRLNTGRWSDACARLQTTEHLCLAGVARGVLGRRAL